MAAKHRYRRPSRHPHLVAAIGGAALGIVGVGTYTAIADSTDVAPVTSEAAPAGPVQESSALRDGSVVQDATVVAISDSSLITRDATGAVMNFAITPGTTSVTPQGSGPVPAQFAVGDTVSIHADFSGNTPVATAVADSAVVDLGGPPMDWISG